MNYVALGRSVTLALAMMIGPALFAQANPIPLIRQPLSPDAVLSGGAAFTLTVRGSGFVSSSVVQWNGSARTTTFVNSSPLQADFTGSVKPGYQVITDGLSAAFNITIMPLNGFTGTVNLTVTGAPVGSTATFQHELDHGRRLVGTNVRHHAIAAEGGIRADDRRHKRELVAIHDRLRPGELATHVPRFPIAALIGGGFCG
jgi:hypothetical protein